MGKRERKDISIVFVDSLQYGAFTVQRLLERFFTDVSVCRSLEDAVRLLDNKQIHLIIENLPISLEHGKDIVARVRKIVPLQIPTLIISSLSVDNNLYLADKLKILEIPINTEELVSSVYELIAV